MTKTIELTDQEHQLLVSLLTQAAESVDVCGGDNVPEEIGLEDPVQASWDLLTKVRQS